MLIIKRHLSVRPFVPVEHEGYRYFGVVQNGLQIGALAQTKTGQYVQVNGSVIQPLNIHRVHRALNRFHPNNEEQPRSPCEASVQPVVTYRKRRRPLQQDGAS